MVCQALNRYVNTLRTYPLTAQRCDLSTVGTVCIVIWASCILRETWQECAAYLFKFLLFRHRLGSHNLILTSGLTQRVQERVTIPLVFKLGIYRHVRFFRQIWGLHTCFISWIICLDWIIFYVWSRLVTLLS